MRPEHVAPDGACQGRFMVIAGRYVAFFSGRTTHGVGLAFVLRQLFSVQVLL